MTRELMLTPAERQKLVLQALDEFERPLMRYATRLLNGDQDAARDAVQHSFLKLCERQEGDESDGEKFENVAPWLYTVCRNRVMDQWRQSKREPIADAESSNGVYTRELGPGDQLEKTALLKLIQKLISRLAASEKEVAELWSQGFTNGEIAAVTGKAEGTVRVCLHRAIKSLRKHAAIKNWFDEEPLVQKNKF
jgi:RNA polymerase sigma factor (sigma-70 family)